MKNIITALLLAFLFDNAYAQQATCDLISDEQLADMHIVRSTLQSENLTIPKEMYGTEVEMVRSDCRYTKQGRSGPLTLVLLSLATVPSMADEIHIRAALDGLYQELQAAVGPPSASSWLKFSISPIENGWCSESTSSFSPAMAGCSGVRQRRFLTINYVDEVHSSDGSRASANAKKYFELIFAKISAK